MYAFPSAPRLDDLVAHFALLDEFDHSASMFSFCISFVLCQSSQEASKKLPITEIAKTMPVLHGFVDFRGSSPGLAELAHHQQCCHTTCPVRDDHTTFQTRLWLKAHTSFLVQIRSKPRCASNARDLHHESARHGSACVALFSQKELFMECGILKHVDIHLNCLGFKHAEILKKRPRIRKPGHSVSA